MVLRLLCHDAAKKVDKRYQTQCLHVSKLQGQSLKLDRGSYYYYCVSKCLVLYVDSRAISTPIKSNMLS